MVHSIFEHALKMNAPSCMYKCVFFFRVPCTISSFFVVWDFFWFFFFCFNLVNHTFLAHVLHNFNNEYTDICTESGVHLWNRSTKIRARLLIMYPTKCYCCVSHTHSSQLTVPPRHFLSLLWHANNLIKH